MSQFDFGTIDDNTKSGTQLAADLNAFRTALNSCHSGSSRPTYAIAKTIWVSDATTPWVVYMFDGTDDIQIGTVNATTNMFTPNMPNTPVGNIASTTIQAAINELDTEKAKVGDITACGVTQSTARILGRTTSSTGAVEEISVGAGLSLSAGSLTATTSVEIQSVTATQGSGAITIGLNPTTLDFRSTTLTTGVVNTRSVASAISLVVPSGAILGTVSTIAARLILVAIDNAGTVELAVVNIAGGNDLSETGLISTSAIDTASDSANVFYSTTARSNVPYRVVGAVDAVNTAGAWGNPTLVQGYGGQALAAMSSLGYGQKKQDVLGSRTIGTTYYNLTGKPIGVTITFTLATSQQGILNINGVISGSVYNTNSSAVYAICTDIVPPYASYSATVTGATINAWTELR